MSLLPQRLAFDPNTYDNGDICDTNIIGLKKKHAPDLAKRVQLSKIMICTPEGPRTVTEEDVLAQKRQRVPK
jgi:hypothetical protein